MERAGKWLGLSPETASELLPPCNTPNQAIIRPQHAAGVLYDMLDGYTAEAAWDKVDWQKEEEEED